MIGSNVRVYWNLHKRCYSIQTRGKSWRVSGHAHEVLLSDCTFVVNAGGQQRVRAQRRKNVHAFIVGRLVGARTSFDWKTPTVLWPAAWDEPAVLRYDPYLNDCFQADQNDVLEAQLVYGTVDGRRPLMFCHTDR